MAVAPTTAPTTPSPTQTATPSPATTPPETAPTSPEPSEPTAEDILPAETRTNTDANIFDEIDDSFLGTPKDAVEGRAITAETPLPAQPPAAPGAAPAEGVPAVPGTEPPPAITPAVDGKAAFEEYRKIANEKLVSYFALDQNAADELAADPVSAVPKLMARTMFETIQATMQAVHHFLPQLIEQHEVRRVAAKEVEDKFYTTWPKLDRKAHDSFIRQAASVYRQMNPSATLEQIINAVGAQAMVAFKIPTETPKAPWQRNPATPQTPTPPHRPAAASTPRAAPTPTERRNIFTEMADDFAAGRDYD
jgi:hypothetical protein